MSVKPAKRWFSLALPLNAQNPAAPGLAWSCEPQHGFWGIAQALETANTQLARTLLEHIQSAVTSGEDLTAAFLLAHGLLQRQLENPEDTSGARVIALRQTRSPGTLELAWVGQGSALLLRKAQPISIVSDRSTQAQAHKGYLFESRRLEGLGGSEKARPRIDRNLINVQKNDIVLLGSGALDLEQHRELVSASFRGFGNFEYKARKLQSALQSVSQEASSICVVQVS